MEWWIPLVILLSGLLAALALGIPVVFAFWIVITAGFFVYMGGFSGIPALITSLRSSIAVFTITPVPFFIIMGDVLFRSGIASRMLNIMDLWLVRLPGRLSLVTVGMGTLFAALSGSSLGTTAMLTRMLEPDMRARGYHYSMIIGPIMASGMLAVIIPPSVLTVILGGLAGISVGRLLIAGVIPGLLFAAFFALYVIGICTYKPSLAPPVDRVIPPLGQKLRQTGLSLLPALFIIFLVLGTIFAGVCTPTEAAAVGAFGTFVLAVIYRKLDWQLVKGCTMSAAKTTSLVLIIATGSMAFSQLLSFTGATRGIMQLASTLPVAPIVIVIATLVVLLVLGCFIDQISMLMIGVPIFVPIATTLGFDPVWYGILFLLAITLGFITPPFGMLFFVVKGIMPGDITMGMIYRSAVPYIWLSLIAMVLVIVFPALATWLPGLMG